MFYSSSATPFKYFLLIQTNLSPWFRQAFGSRCAWKYSQPKGENGFNQSFMFFFFFLFLRSAVYIKMVNMHLAISISLSSSWVCISGGTRVESRFQCLPGVNTLQLLVILQSWNCSVHPVWRCSHGLSLRTWNCSVSVEDGGRLPRLYSSMLTLWSGMEWNW